MRAKIYEHTVVAGYRLPQYIIDIIKQYAITNNKSRSVIFTKLLGHGINFVENFNGGDIQCSFKKEADCIRVSYATDKFLTEIVGDYATANNTNNTMVVTTLLLHGINFVENFNNGGI